MVDAFYAPFEKGDYVEVISEWSDHEGKRGIVTRREPTHVLLPNSATYFVTFDGGTDEHGFQFVDLCWALRNGGPTPLAAPVSNAVLAIFVDWSVLDEIITSLGG